MFPVLDTARTPRFHTPVQELFREKLAPVGGRGYHGNILTFEIIFLPMTLCRDVRILLVLHVTAEAGVRGRKPQRSRGRIVWIFKRLGLIYEAGWPSREVHMPTWSHRKVSLIYDITIAMRV
jgi:hypothetical protein